jgi:hypothetical protein
VNWTQDNLDRPSTSSKGKLSTGGCMKIG